MPEKEAIRRAAEYAGQADILYAQVLKEIEKSDLENADYIGIEAALKEFAGTGDAGKARVVKKPWAWLCSPIFTPRMYLDLCVAVWYALLLGNIIAALHFDNTVYHDAAWTMAAILGGIVASIVSGVLLFRTDNSPSYFAVAVESLE